MLGPEPTPELERMIAELRSMASMALGGPQDPSTPLPKGWQTLHFGTLMVRGLPPDDIEIRFEGRLVYADIHKGTSYGTKSDFERSIDILKSHFVLEALARI